MGLIDLISAISPKMLLIMTNNPTLNIQFVSPCALKSYLDYNLHEVKNPLNARITRQRLR